MATLPTYFNDFLSNIRLSQNQINDLKTGHQTLRKRLENDEDLSAIIVSTFLQGSYRRSTAVKPKNGSKSDVDVIVVTKLDAEEYTPEQALNVFVPFLDKHYNNKYRIQGRSIGIDLSYAHLDIVPTSAPSESEYGILEDKGLTDDNEVEIIEKLFESTEIYRLFNMEESDPEWKTEPLLIPDRNAEIWDQTHPLEQIRWTIEKNKKCNQHYVNVVKALKWWRKVKYPDVDKPKSYPLEHFIGDCCPDGITSVAEGVVETLENIVNNYPTKPFLSDRGVPSHDVFERISDDEYDAFYNSVCNAADIARKAYDAVNIYDSVCLWRELFGNEFPKAPESQNSGNGGFTSRTEKTISVPEGRFA